MDYSKHALRTDKTNDKILYFSKKKNSISKKDLIRTEIKDSLVEYADLAHLVGPYTVQYDASRSINQTSVSSNIDKKASSFKKKR